MSYAKAFSGQCFLNLAAMDPEANEAEQRGNVLLKRCRDGFPGSEWARLASQN